MRHIQFVYVFGDCSRCVTPVFIGTDDCYAPNGTDGKTKKWKTIISNFQEAGTLYTFETYSDLLEAMYDNGCPKRRHRKVRPFYDNSSITNPNIETIFIVGGSETKIPFRNLSVYLQILESARKNLKVDEMQESIDVMTSSGLKKDDINSSLEFAVLNEYQLIMTLAAEKANRLFPDFPGKLDFWNVVRRKQITEHDEQLVDRDMKIISMDRYETNLDIVAYPCETVYQNRTEGELYIPASEDDCFIVPYTIR